MNSPLLQLSEILSIPCSGEIQIDANVAFATKLAHGYDFINIKSAKTHLPLVGSIVYLGADEFEILKREDKPEISRKIESYNIELINSDLYVGYPNLEKISYAGIGELKNCITGVIWLNGDGKGLGIVTCDFSVYMELLMSEAEIARAKKRPDIRWERHARKK